MLRNGFGDRVAFRGVSDGGKEEVSPGQPAKAGVHFRPAIDRAGHGDSVDATDGHCSETLGVEKRRRQRARGGTGAVQTPQLARLRFPIENKQIAADTAAHGLNHTKDGVGGDGRIRSGTTAGKRLGTGLGGKRMAGGGNATVGNDHGAPVAPSVNRQWIQHGVRISGRAARNLLSSPGAASPCPV